jgi:hypothetical protein
MPSKNKLLKQKEKEEAREKIEQEKLIDEYWKEGTNKKKEAKDKIKDQKQIEKMQKQKEKKELQSLEELMTDQIKVNKTKSKKKDDAYLLKKTLENKIKTRQEKEKEEMEALKKINKQQDIINQSQKEERLKLKQMYDRELEAKNISTTISFNENIATIGNIDDALLLLEDEKDEAFNFNDFYEKKLKSLKQSFPGLKLSQYNDRIQKHWVRINNKV